MSASSFVGASMPFLRRSLNLSKMKIRKGIIEVHDSCIINVIKMKWGNILDGLLEWSITDTISHLENSYPSTVLGLRVNINSAWILINHFFACSLRKIKEHFWHYTYFNVSSIKGTDSHKFFIFLWRVVGGETGKGKKACKLFKCLVFLFTFFILRVLLLGSGKTKWNTTLLFRCFWYVTWNESHGREIQYKVSVITLRSLLSRRKKAFLKNIFHLKFLFAFFYAGWMLVRRLMLVITNTSLNKDCWSLEKKLLPAINITLFIQNNSASYSSLNPGNFGFTKCKKK